LVQRGETSTVSAKCTHARDGPSRSRKGRGTEEGKRSVVVTSGYEAFSEGCGKGESSKGRASNLFLKKRDPGQYKIPRRYYSESVPRERRETNGRDNRGVFLTRKSD